MEGGYPLQTYSSHHSQSFGHDDYVSPNRSPYSWGASPHIPSIPAPYRGNQRGYMPLHDNYPSHENIQPRTSSRFRLSPFLALWLLEIMALFLAAGSLAGVVVVLRWYNGRSLIDTKFPGHLTLNGIVAALSTLSRVALMVPVGSALSQESWVWFSKNVGQHRKCHSRLKDFELSDEASRSAWGSILFMLFARRRYIAYIGVITTLLSLAFGTFTQQLLSIAEFPVTDPDSHLLPGSLPRAESWQYFNSIPTNSKMTPPFSIRAATYSGILSNKVDPISVTCATGNCTWPITPSLAICGACSPSNYDQSCDETSCNYTMPSGSSYILSGLPGGVGYVVGFTGQSFQYNETVDNRLYLTHFDALGGSYKTLAQGFDKNNITASECALWMCIQSFNSVMLNGVLEENVTMEFSDLSTPVDTVSGSGFENYTFADLPAEMNPSPDIVYNVSLFGAAGFGWMSELFNGSAYLGEISSAAETDTVDAIWNSSSNLDPWIKQVATSMTNALRYDDPNPHPPSRSPIQPAPPRSMYAGTSFQLGIQVRWIWLILPVVCVVLSVVFLILVMIEIARNDIVPWKGSLLAFIFVDIDQELKQLAANMVSSNRGQKMTNAVGDQKATLQKDFKGHLILKIA